MTIPASTSPATPDVTSTAPSVREYTCSLCGVTRTLDSTRGLVLAADDTVAFAVCTATAECLAAYEEALDDLEQSQAVTD